MVRRSRLDGEAAPAAEGGVAGTLRRRPPRPQPGCRRCCPLLSLVSGLPWRRWSKLSSSEAASSAATVRLIFAAVAVERERRG